MKKISGWVGSRRREEVFLFHIGHYLKNLLQMLLLSLLGMPKAIEGLHEANSPGSLEIIFFSVFFLTPRTQVK